MLSLFDDTMGALNREVTVSGSGTDNTLFGGDDSWFQIQFRDAMNENQIGTLGVRVNKANSRVHFEIDVDALPGHTGEQVRRMVQQAVENKRYSYQTPNLAVPWMMDTQTRRVLANVTTAVLRDPGQPTSNASPQQVPPTQTSQSPWSINPNPVAPAAPSVGGLDLSSFAVGGLSGGLVVGALLLVLALKK